MEAAAVEMMTMILVQSRLPGKKHPKEEMMNLKINLKQERPKLFLYFYIFGLFILSFMLFACGDGNNNSNNNSADSSDTGSIAFNIVWDGGPSNRIARALDVCADYHIETINATVTNSSNTTVAVASESWPCSDRQGTITDVPPGSGFQVIIEGLVTGESTPRWRGQVTDITVIAGQTAGPYTITVSYIAAAALLWDVHSWDNANWN